MVRKELHALDEGVFLVTGNLLPRKDLVFFYLRHFFIRAYMEYSLLCCGCDWGSMGVLGK